MILIYCEGSSGQASLPETLVNGNPLPVRRYDILDHYIAIDTGHGEADSHDALALLTVPGFRLATPDEQNAYAETRQKKTSVRENAGSGGSKQAKQVANGG